MELLSAIAFEDDIMTQDEQQLDDNTTTIPESQPPTQRQPLPPWKLQTQQRLQLPPMRQAEATSSLYLNSHPSGSRPPPPTLPTQVHTIQVMFTMYLLYAIYAH